MGDYIEFSGSSIGRRSKVYMLLICLLIPVAIWMWYDIPTDQPQPAAEFKTFTPSGLPILYKQPGQDAYIQLAPYQPLDIISLTVCVPDNGCWVKIRSTDGFEGWIQENR